MGGAGSIREPRRSRTARMPAPITKSAPADRPRRCSGAIGRTPTVPVNRHGSSRHCIELRSRSPRIPRSSVETLVCPAASATRVERCASSLSGSASVVQPTSRRPEIAARQRCHASDLRRADDRCPPCGDPSRCANVPVSSPERGDAPTVFWYEPAIPARARVMARVICAMHLLSSTRRGVGREGGVGCLGWRSSTWANANAIGRNDPSRRVQHRGADHAPRMNECNEP